MKRKGKLKLSLFNNKGHFPKRIWFIYGLSLGLISLPLSAKAEGKILNSSIEQSVHQNRKISGNVVDENGEALIGVSILVKGTTNGIITDLDGNFTLDVPADGTLIISYVGYKKQEVKISNQQKLSIIMLSDNKLLDEVVVVGYGVVKKSDLTGSVGSVKAENISAKGSTSLMESLQGQVAGVNISQSSSRAGDGFNIQIRGKSSLSGGEPLYVIDGVVCDNMNFLNPMDIEKVDILKDASSTAIYGSRATNGVVMITTKKGDSNVAKTTVSYDGYYGVKTTANMPDFMNGDEFLKFRFSRYLVSSLDASTGLTKWEMTQANFLNFWGGNSQVIKDMYANKNYTDWTDIVTRDGSQQNHFLNIAGNAKNISYRIGLGYQNEKGILYDGYERWNLKAAIDHKISDKISAGFSTNMSTSIKRSGSSNSILEGFRMTPTMPCYYWEGENAGQLIVQPGKDAAIYPNGGGPTSSINPVVDRENSKDDTRAYDAMANLYFQYSPIKEVILKTTFSPMYSKTHRGTFYNSQTQARSGKTNMAENYNDQIFSYTWDTQANYSKTFGDHSLNALALFSVYQQKLEGDYINVVDMPFDVDWYNLASGTVQSQSSYYKKLSMLSYVARVNYSYKGRYMATVSSRWDGSSKFQKNNRWGMFPSAALAWRISEEKFMKPTNEWLNNLKLRTSFGITGNNAGVGPYDTQALANIKYYYNMGTSVANGYGYTMTNSDLTWEKTTELNLGLDFGFFNNRINGSIDVYNKDSKDLLMEMETPFELGSYTGSIVNNVGKVNNKGIEIQLSTINVRNKDWNWETTFSFARNINSIKELNDAKEDLVGNKWFIGHPIDVVYGYKYTGICTREEAQAYATDSKMKTKFYEGEMKILDKDENGTIDANDKMILGHSAPSWTGNFVSNLAYKNVDFSVSIYTSQGGTVYSPFMSEFVDYSQRGMMRLNMDYYIPEGAPILGTDGSITYQDATHYGKYPFPTNGGNGKGGGSYWTSGNNEDRSQNFVDNSFVRVKNITLGYTFPQKWVSKLNVANLRIYANLINPFTFTNYKGFDPEWADASVGDGTGGVSSRTYQIGVNLKF
ncbi:MAG: rane protein [Bacteroidetes bacterium]|nr:rane protein [Bacteroidota bacterium]